MADLKTEAMELLDRVKGYVYGGVTLPWNEVVALYECLAAFAYQPPEVAPVVVEPEPEHAPVVEPVPAEPITEPVGETQPGA